MEPDSICYIIDNSNSISAITLGIYLFSGVGGALLTYFMTTNRSKRKESDRKEIRKNELLELIYDEITINSTRISSMISDPFFRPYWLLSVKTFDSIVSEITTVIEDESTMRSVFNRYRNYKMINRQLDLLHFRPEGLKATIYLESTLPLAEAEFQNSNNLRINIARKLKLSNVQRIEVKALTSPEGCESSYKDINAAYKQAWVDVESYWDLLALFGMKMFSAVMNQLHCSTRQLRVALISDPNGFMMPSFFRTLHFRNNDDGTYRFRIQLKLLHAKYEMIVSIPITIWISERDINVRIRNGEYKFKIPVEGNYDFKMIAKNVIGILRKLLENNIKDIKPE